MLLRLFLIHSAALIFLSGCFTSGLKPVLRVEPVKPQQSAAVIEVKEKNQGLSVAIVPFGEKRGNLKSYGSVYKYLIPLMPYGTIRYERPDEARMFNTQNEFEFNMSENLLKVWVDSVKKCGLFDNLVVTPTPLVSGTDLILSGDILSTLYEGKTYSYGISFAGPVLWCIGLPAGSSYKKLNMLLRLKKRDTGEQIWSFNLDEEDTVVQGLYHNWGKEVNSFVTLMNRGAKKAITDLGSKISGIPTELLKAKILKEESPASPDDRQGQPVTLQKEDVLAPPADVPSLNP